MLMVITKCAALCFHLSQVLHQFYYPFAICSDNAHNISLNFLWFCNKIHIGKKVVSIYIVSH